MTETASAGGSGGTVHRGPPGFDVSAYQHALTPQRVGELHRAGYRHAGIKMSEGSYLTDANFGANRAALRAHAFPRWLYHEMVPHASHHLQTQFERIMEASGAMLYPRERIALVLGDFKVPADQAHELAEMLELHGPIKHRRERAWRPKVILYANLSNWKTTYVRLTTRPRIVAAFPGPVDIDCVIHQDANHDPATNGDHDVWMAGPQTPEEFFLQ